MDLDKRIIEGKKPLDCFDAKDARKQFIGKKGFFGAHESQFMNLDTCPKCVFDELKEVDNYDDSPFITSCNHCYRFFLPEEWVKESEKKYRPYTIKDFEKAFLNGEFEDFIIFRDKHNPDDIYTMMYNGNFRKGQFEYICLGAKNFSFESLFENYEVADYDGEWRPFGVIEE